MLVQGTVPGLGTLLQMRKVLGEVGPSDHAKLDRQLGIENMSFFLMKPVEQAICSSIVTAVTTSIG